MEVVCIKYNEKMESEDACCKHPGDYCKFRKSCIIHFMESEKTHKSDPSNVGGCSKDNGIEER